VYFIKKYNLENLLRKKHKLNKKELCFFILKVMKGIVCTPSHRIYIEKKGWIKASDIIENDELLLYNNANGIIQRIEIEKPEVTYNFEVEDYHNYFVSEEIVLVHNDCALIDLDCPNGVNNIQNEIQTGSTNDYSIHKSRRAAYPAARKDAGVLHQRPTSITNAYNRRGHWIPGKHYNFGDIQILKLLM